MKLNKLTVLCLITTGLLTITAISRADDAAPAAPASTPAPETAPAAKGKSSALKFYGPVTAVDTNAMTFVVADQTYVVDAKTKITDKADKKATLADAVVGQPARGDYIKGADGKFDVTKVRFGKKTGGKGGGKKKKTEDAASSDTKPAATTGGTSN